MKKESGQFCGQSGRSEDIGRRFLLQSSGQKGFSLGHRFPTGLDENNVRQRHSFSELSGKSCPLTYRAD
jgi:hypothetical protein